MSALFDPGRQEPLCDEPREEAAVSRTIAEIVGDVLCAAQDS